MNINSILTISIGEVKLTEEGEVLVLHLLGCSNCSSYGAVYLDMSTVDRDNKVNNLSCPLCKEESLELITYRLMDRLREIENENQEDSSDI